MLKEAISESTLCTSTSSCAGSDVSLGGGGSGAPSLSFLTTGLLPSAALLPMARSRLAGLSLPFAALLPMARSLLVRLEEGCCLPGYLGSRCQCSRS